jgi:hypothetical protein
METVLSSQSAVDSFQRFVMASVELTLDQLVDAARQLPEEKRKALLKAIENLPSPEQAHAAAKRLRGRFRLGAKKRKRLSELLFKGNAGTLSADDREELDHLVDEFERKTLELARAMADVGNRAEASRSNDHRVRHE